MGLDAAIAAVPELGQDRAAQLAILNATIATWDDDYTDHTGGRIDERRVGARRDLHGRPPR